MTLNNKHVLVTGGNGFIGVNLTKKLKALNAEVDNFDRIDGNDIANIGQVTQFIKRGYHVIFHLAGLSGPLESNNYPSDYLKTNTLATANICSLIVKHSPQTKLILSNSRQEYGTPINLPVDENHPTLPTTVYGISKLASTQLAMVFSQSCKLDATVFRTSNVYGPYNRVTKGGYNIINKFINLAQSDQTIEIFGDGLQKRDYIYIDDLINAFVLASTKEISRGKVYNLGFGRGISLINMAEMIIQNIKKGNIKHIKWPQKFEKIETGSYVSDISKISKELGFKPKIDFNTGIKMTLAYL